jgi:hypothetical protein
VPVGTSGINLVILIEEIASEIPDRRERTVADRTSSTLNQIFRPIESLPKRLKSVRIIAFAFFLEGSVPKWAYGGTKVFDRLVPNPEGCGQSIFQNLSVRIKRLCGPVVESQRFPVPTKAIGVVSVRSKPATGFALTLPTHPANLGLPLE